MAAHIVYRRISFMLCKHWQLLGKQAVRRYSSMQWNEVKPIYYGPLATSVKLLKVFSLSTCVATIVGTPILVYYGKRSISVRNKIIIGSVLISISVGTTLLLHWFSKRYVLQAYSNASNSKFMMETYTLFARRKRIEFGPGDVKVPAKDQMFTTVEIFNKPYLFHLEIIQNKNLLMLVTGLNFNDLQKEFSHKDSGTKS